MARKETGVQFLARLGTRPSIENIEPKLFENGPSCKDVIELYGQEGTGKTEALLHIIASCILSPEWRGITLDGRDAGVILVDTDYKFSILRLALIMEQHIINSAKQTSMAAEINAQEMESYICGCLEKLHVVRCTSSAQLVVTLHSLENLVCNQPDISVIMVDSLSAFYWVDRSNGGESLAAQEHNLRLAVDILSKLVSSYNLVLIVTKAALYKKKSREERHGLPRGNKALDFDSEHSEFLCKSWQRLVTYRLVLLKLDNTESRPQVFQVGGDYLSQPSTFVIESAGLKFSS